MTNLSELIEVRHRVVRAVSLESDLRDPDVLRGYSPGAHVIDALRRIAISFQDGPRTRAWSITGPYGAGKSSFAHLLCAVLASKQEPTHPVAMKLLRGADSQLSDTLSRERRRLGIEQRGAICAAVVAEREPVTRALLRGLHQGANWYWSGPGRKPDVVHRLSKASAEKNVSPDVIFDLLAELEAHAPVFVIVDELGKNLDYAADRTSDGDLYVLQQLAEHLSSNPSFRGGVLTLAHLAFEDYLLGAREIRRREWRKIHGRFEDIPFVADSAHAVGLLTEALHFTGTASHLQAITKDTALAEEALGKLAIKGPGALTGTSPGTYPLHPTVALALPVLAARLAQHDRSLVAFLTSDAPHALPAFLAKHELGPGNIPFMRLADLYDYFFEDGEATALAGPDGERAREIAARIEQTSGIDDIERRVLKTIGTLNLISGTQSLVASAALVEQALVGPRAGAKARSQIQAAIERLSERSVLTFRDFAGEYRVWEGSDFDTAAQIAAAREQLTTSGIAEQSVLGILAQAQPLRPAVARRHSQRNHVLRYFEARYADSAPDGDVDVSTDSPDGLVLHVLADKRAPAKAPAQTASGRPLIVVWSPYGKDVREAALDFAAASAVLTGAPELDRDPVARREVRHRVAALQQALARQIEDAFSGARAGVYWFISGRRTPAQGPAEFSRRLSELCDARYQRTPVIRNEMVNRRELTSQGAKARRTLLERMFTNEPQPRLGITGYGPERAMYEAVLHHTGLHAERGETWGFGTPPKDSELADIWTHLMDRLDGVIDTPLNIAELYSELVGPPFGMKVGAIPVLLSAALQYRADDVFLYQDQSFQPVIEASHIERLLKTPERFSLKRASFVGLRASVFAQLRDALSGERPHSSNQTRNETTLSVVRPLIAFVAGLPEYTRGTTSVSPTAQAVCKALLDAREPDELLLTALPTACGLAPFRADGEASEDKQAAEYVERLRRALTELGAAYQLLLEQIGDLLHAGFAVAGSKALLREDLRGRSRRLLKQVIEPKMRSFLMSAADENLDDDDWLEALAMTISSKPPGSWTDHDLLVFEALVAERAQWFQRLELLYHQMQSLHGTAFDARRVTLTAPDGTETAELVSVDAATEDLVGDILNNALSELEQRLNPQQASRALLGVLANRLLSASEPIPQETSKPKRKASNR